MSSILSYAKLQEMESVITQSLIERFSYLIAVREEVVEHLDFIDDAMDELIVEMKNAGFEFDE